MTLDAITVATSAALVALLLACVSLGVSARVVRRTRDRVRRRAEERMRPLVMEVLDDPAHVTRLPTSGRDGRAVRSIVVGVLPKLRGADRDELAAVLARDGQLDRARRDLTSRRARRRMAAADLLGAAGASDADTALAALTHDRDRRVRVAAVRALGRLGTSTAAITIVEALLHERVPANTCTMALLRLGRPAAGALTAAFVDPTTPDRAVVADLLGVLGVHDARPQLEAMLTGAPTARERVSAAQALGRLGDPASTPVLVAVLQRTLDDADLDLAVASVTALGLIGDRRAIPILTDALARNHRLSFAAAEALAPMGPRRSRRSMLERGEATAPVASILSARRVQTAPASDGNPRADRVDPGVAP